jgi:hypothetical protein
MAPTGYTQAELDDPTVITSHEDGLRGVGEHGGPDPSGAGVDRGGE